MFSVMEQIPDSTPLSQVRPIANRSSGNIEVVVLDELLRDAEKEFAGGDDDRVVQGVNSIELLKICLKIFLIF